MAADDAPTGPSVEELEDRWLRARADYENLRKRLAREVTAARDDERERVAGDWLPVLDNLERALGHATEDPDPVIEGVRAVRDQAVDVLTALGFPRHEETGVPFDPRRHEAVAARPDPQAAPGTVLEVVRAGYGEGLRQLRPAAVVVAAAAG